MENNSNYLIEKSTEEGFNQNEISIRDIEVECSPTTATVTCPCESHVPGQACSCYQQPYYESGLWCRVTIGGSGGYSDLGFSDFYGHINTGTTGPGNTGGGGETSSPTSYYQYLLSIYDAPQIKKANRIKDSLCTQYGLNLPITSFWDIFGDASTEFINANAAWTHNQPINKLNLFENAFQELIFLKNIGYTLDMPDNSTTPAYKWLKDQYYAFLPMKNYLSSHQDDESKEALYLHLQTMVDNSDYFYSNQILSFPAFGSAQWAETIDFIYAGNDPYSIWGRLTSAEKYLCMESPRKALIIARNTKIAGEKSRQVYAVTGKQERNTMCDAFRHTLWVALNAQSINESSVIEFYTARESETPAHLLLEKDMDMHNNYWGLQIGNNNPTASVNMLTAIILQNYMHPGVLRYLSPIDFNDSL